MKKVRDDKENAEYRASRAIGMVDCNEEAIFSRIGFFTKSYNKPSAPFYTVSEFRTPTEKKRIENGKSNNFPIVFVTFYWYIIEILIF